MLLGYSPLGKRLCLVYTSQGKGFLGSAQGLVCSEHKSFNSDTWSFHCTEKVHLVRVTNVTLFYYTPVQCICCLLFQPSKPFRHLYTLLSFFKIKLIAVYCDPSTGLI